MENYEEKKIEQHHGNNHSTRNSKQRDHCNSWG